MRALAHDESGGLLVVHGCGEVGLSAVQVAVAAGARVEVGPGPLELARRYGAEVLVTAGDEHGATAVLFEATGGGAAASLDVAGSPATCTDSNRGLRTRGRHDHPPMLSLIAAGRLRPQDLVTRWLALDQAGAALASLGATPGDRPRPRRVSSKGRAARRGARRAGGCGAAHYGLAGGPGPGRRPRRRPAPPRAPLAPRSDDRARRRAPGRGPPPRLGAGLAETAPAPGPHPWPWLPGSRPLAATARGGTVPIGSARFRPVRWRRTTGRSRRTTGR